MGYKPDIYPLKPTPPPGLGSAVSANTTKPLAQAAHNYQLHISDGITLMHCKHCGETYRLYFHSNDMASWVKLDFMGNNFRAMEPGACALPEATQ